MDGPVGVSVADVSSSEILMTRDSRGGPGRLGHLAVALAVLSAFATFFVLAGLTPIEPTHQVVVTTLVGNIVFAVVLVSIIGWELTSLNRARRRGSAGAQIHGRIVALFSIVAAAPALLLAIVAAITIDRGLDNWFSERARAIVDNSLVVARAYLDEHARSIRGDVLAMANDLNRAHTLFESDRPQFEQLLRVQAAIRGVPVAILFKPDMAVVARAEQQGGRTFPMPPQPDVEAADSAEPILLAPGRQNAIGALLKLSAFDDTVLFVARAVDPRANQYLQLTEQGVSEYQMLAQRRFGVQVAFALMYFVIALTLLLAAIWLGIAFANKLVAPLRRLITAADQVALGNLYVQVPLRRGEGDLGGFAETFNKMTAQLRSQRNALVEANEQFDGRRLFTEAVLAGVSAAVVGVDEEGRITLINRTGERLLAATEADLLGRPIGAAVPELAALLSAAMTGGQRLAQGQMTLSRGGRERNLSVRVTTELSPGHTHGYVVTLDDITDLVAAQRSSAWADVARRIAHEIKNPLTPIQLSAERIRRRVGKMEGGGYEIIEQCTDTIVRQVETIQHMVNEFSSFARMPKPAMTQDNLADTIRKVVLDMRVGYPDLEIAFEAPEAPVSAVFDRRMLSQAVGNIVKNATEAVSTVPDRRHGRIEVTIRSEGGRIDIDVADNGPGFPRENRHRLLEPYMTTREKGTGLGLAIVGKIFEEHGGGIELLDAPAVAEGGHGAMVRLWLPASAPSPTAESGGRQERQTVHAD